MNGKALGDEHNASRVVTHTFVTVVSVCVFDVSFDVDLDEI